MLYHFFSHEWKMDRKVAGTNLFFLHNCNKRIGNWARHNPQWNQKLADWLNCVKIQRDNIIFFLHCDLNCYEHGLQTTDAQWSLFSSKSQTFGLGQTIWVDTFWGIWGIFSRTISTHFGTVSPLSMFFIIQPLILRKTKPLYPHPKYLFGIGIWIWAAKN